MTYEILGQLASVEPLRGAGFLAGSCWVAGSLYTRTSAYIPSLTLDGKWHEGHLVEGFNIFPSEEAALALIEKLQVPRKKHKRMHVPLF